MKNKWLLASLISLVSIYFNSFFKTVFIIACIVYWFIRFRDKTVVVLILLLLLINIDKYQKTDMIEDYYIVEKISAYSTILKSNNKLYKTKKLDVNYDDKISITGTIGDIKDSYYFFGVPTSIYSYSSFVYQMIDVTDFKVIEKGKTIRNRLWNRIDSLDSESKSFYKSLIFQYNDDSLELSDSFQSLVYSGGVYLTGVVNLITTTLNYFISEEITQIMLIGGLFLCGIKTRFTCSLLRIILRKILSRIENKRDRLGLLIICLLTINKYFAYNMSFLIPISLSFFNLYDRKKNPLTKFISIIPIQLLLNYKFNFIESFLYQYIRYFYLIVYFASFICLSLNITVWPSLLIPLLNGFESSRILTISGKPSFIIFVLFIGFGISYLSSGRKKSLVVLFVLLMVNQYQSLFNPLASFTFLNVNHGDCFIYQPAFSLNCLIIDTGSEFNYSKVERYLNGRGLKQIDTLIVTHEDSDHNGNVESIKNDFNVKNTIDQKTGDIRFHNVDFTELLVNEEYEDKNSNSQIIYTNINGIYYLLMADGTVETEKDILRYYPDLKVDVLKLGHHGSNTSSSIDFLSEIYPEIAIISCGDYQIFHHPHESVVNNLDNLNIPFLTTNSSGDIRIISLIYHNLLLTAKGEYAIINTQK